MQDSTFEITYYMPAEVHDGDPWKYDGLIISKFLQNYRIDLDPLNLSTIILIDKVFELPGFPIRSTGILLRIDMRVMKIFSNKGRFNATFSYYICSF